MEKNIVKKYWAKVLTWLPEITDREVAEQIDFIKIGSTFLFKGLYEIRTPLENIATGPSVRSKLSDEQIADLLDFIEVAYEAGFVETSSDYFEPRWKAEQSGFIKIQSIDGIEYQQ